MNDKNTYMRFIPGVIFPESKTDRDLWFIYCGNKLMVKPGDSNISLPTWVQVREYESKFIRTHYLGILEGTNCYCAEFPSDITIPSGFELMDLRIAGVMMEEALFLIAGKAIQIIYWDQTHQYCGRCGTRTEIMENERAKSCPECGLINYPRISPAIIVAITKGNKILLAHNNRFQNNMYSVVAGFVEPGETFEDCVKREVFEEVGIHVKNIKYFASQPWPFPNSLMIGFTAEYESGDIKPDGIEIGSADWFDVDTLPNLPSKISVARKLIDWFIENYK